jgi:hypothetical protein
MSTQADDAVRLRMEDASLTDSLSQVERDPSLGMPCLVAQTRTLSRYPTSAQQFFACSPLSVLGPEVEGGTGTLSVGNSTFFALNLGSAIPPSGTSVIVTYVDNRWVFRFDA